MNPILVEVRRGGVLESFHRGVVCVVDAQGEIIFSKGDIEQISYPRSAMKLFQHIPLISSGIHKVFEFSSKEISIMCGSHNGENQHQEVVYSILDKLGLNESHLKCGAQKPTLKSDYEELIRTGKPEMQVHNNCSGKHAGFLALCKKKGYDIESYLEFDHKLQKEIRKTVSVYYEVDENDLITGIDGCSAPTFAMPVKNMAIAFKNLCNPNSNITKVQYKASQVILESIKKHPEMLAGTNRYCTDLIKVTEGRIIGKTGADGIYSLVIPSEGIGITVKIDDGKMGPQYQVVQEILKINGWVSQKEYNKLEEYRKIELRNFSGKVVGESFPVDLN